MGAIFLGTPAAAVPSLGALVQIEDVDLVITQPDRPVGRSSATVPSAVKTAALQFGFRVEQPESSSELAALLSASHCRFGLIVAYGRILPSDMLEAVPMGFLNVHFSLLPRWRGAAPVERAIAAGDETTGVTLMKIDEGLDTGPILAERVTSITPTETGGSLTARLAYLGSTLVDAAVPEYLSGRRVPVPQIATGATHAARLTKDEARITADTNATDAARRVRAFSPRPGAWVASEIGALKIRSAVEGPTSTLDPGTIGAEHGSIVLALQEGSLLLGEVQPEGKLPMTADAWMNGRRGMPVQLV
jgi:methionyl-tRNA formyltransferase